MKSLLAIAFLIFVVTEAHHTPEHTLRGPRYAIGKVQVYDVELNVTAGIPGLSGQVSKAAFKGELHVYAKTEKEHILKVTKVFTSGSVKGVEGKDVDVHMQKSRELEALLSIPIKFTLENGEVTSYTLSPRESLESKKIKKAILRSLEMHIPGVALQQLDSSKPSRRIPVVYNVTKDESWGQHTTHYMITVSPDVEFPYSDIVYNISRTESLEGNSYHIHHNFKQENCESTCDEETSSEQETECKSTDESHQIPIRTYVQHNHHLVLEEGIMTPEIIKTVEVHDAKMYDQDMKVMIRQKIRKIGYSRNMIDEPTGQNTYTDLQDQEVEINENEISHICEDPVEAVEAAKRLMRELASIIVQGSLENEKSTVVGEKIILLKRALSKLTISDLKTLSREINPKSSLRRAPEVEKVKRQIWMDILPLIGTSDSVSFIASYIKENVDKELLMWEAKEMLEALPSNIQMPNENMLSELKALMSLPEAEKNHIFHSAIHSCLARIIRSLCSGSELQSSNSNRAQRAMFGMYEHSHRNLQQTSSTSTRSRPECPSSLANEILHDIMRKLAATKKQDEIIIYLNTLTKIGASEVLPVIAEYAYGTAENIQDFSDSYIEFVKSAAIYSLHNVADRFPEDVLQIVMPTFFNETEVPKIRAAAFGVLIRSHPPIEVLQHVASHSWSERSNEVGSFVTSTMDTYGNATLPCMQLTAHRIKQVMPLLKRFDIGAQHAKNLYRSYFDDIRMFGLKNHFKFIPSNVSDFPSAIYHALSYSSGPLVDTLFEGALNIQGPEDDIWGRVIGYMFGFEMPSKESIPSSKEREIFKEAKIVDRIPETLRLTLYKRLFYSSSFYYLDSKNMKLQVDTLKQYVGFHLKTSKNARYSGHLLKLMLPSSLHTLTVAKSLPYPVEFQMDHPMVLAMKIEPKDSSAAESNYIVRPSVYISKLLTHQVKNIGDCKEVGVYHEHKLVISYPVEVKFQAKSLLDATVQYKLPQLPRRILYYFTESGTYADKKDLEMLPSSKDRKPIRTLPSPLRNSNTINFIGLPPIHAECHSEDIGLVAEELPSNPWEVVDFAVKKILNAGWRYKSANISLQEDSTTWPQDTEVTFTVQHSRTHFTKTKQIRRYHEDSPSWSGDQTTMRSNEWMSAHQDDESWSAEAPLQKSWWDRSDKDYSDDKWTQELKDDDILSNGNPSTFINQAKKMSSIISSSLPHVTHVISFNIETRPVHSFANLKAEFNHSYSASLQAYHVDAVMKLPNEHTAKQLSFDHVIGVSRKPDEFHYNEFKDDQKAVFVTGLRTRDVGCSCPWKDVEVVAKGAFKYEPLDDILNKELKNRVEHKFFLPEDHDQCVEDVKNGHSQSSSCLKAIKERSSFNRLGVSVLWNNPSETLKNWGRRLEMFIKHTFYSHMSNEYRPNNENKIHISLNHIEKLTDRPLFDVTIKKPKETISLRRINAFALPLNSVHDVLSLDSMSFSNNTYPPTCVMMEKSVRTYDLKYYPLSVEGCSYILSSHCTKDKNFAIITKILSADGKKELHVHIGRHTLLMTPMSGNHYTVKYDGEEYVINEPYIFDEKTSEIYVLSEKYESQHRHLEVVAKKAGIRIVYDGKNVKVEIDRKYKGQTCGLCSEFDGETIREFRGIDRCLYSHPADFVNSAIIKEGNCRKQASHPYICEDSKMALLRGSSSSTKYAPSIKRNIIKVQGNDLCFSVLPVPVCDEDSEPSETDSLQVGFHCLPRQDVTAKRMVSEAKRRSLGELENKSVDYEENVEVAKMC